LEIGQTSECLNLPLATYLILTSNYVTFIFTDLVTVGCLSTYLSLKLMTDDTVSVN